MLPPFDRADVVRVQTDCARAGRDAAVAVDEVLRDAAAQVVPDADVCDVPRPPLPTSDVIPWRPYRARAVATHPASAR